MAPLGVKGESGRGTGGAVRGALGIWNILALVVTQMFTYYDSMVIILLLFIIYAIF